MLTVGGTLRVVRYGMLALSLTACSKDATVVDAAVGDGPEVSGDAGSLTSVLQAPAMGAQVVSTALDEAGTDTESSQVLATLTDPVGLAEAQLFVDGSALPAHAWQFSTEPTVFALDYHLDMPPGAHSIAVEASNDAGQVVRSTPVSVTVTDGVQMTSPHDLDSVVTPVDFSGVAHALTGHNITGMHIYVDDVDTWKSTTAGGNAYAFETGPVALPLGTHNVTVQSWDDETPQRITRARLRLDVTGTAIDAGSVPSADPYFVTAGDIAGAGDTQADVAALIAKHYADAKYVITLGDNAYGSSHDTRVDCKGKSVWAQGGMDTYLRFFEPSWGMFKAKMLPTTGNHEYGNYDSQTTKGCDGQARVMEGYYSYFTGSNAGSPGKSLELGGTTWDTFHYGYDIVTASGKKYRYIALNSGPCFYPPYDSQNCGTGSGEFAWLSNELATHKKTMLGGDYVGVIVGTHFNRWQSAGCYGGSGNLGPFLSLMQGTVAGPGQPATDYHVDLFLNGHVHNYERFCGLAATTAKVTRSCGSVQGPVCDASGPVEINVGTGGADNGSSAFGEVWSASQQRLNAAGILKVTLHDASLDFDFRDTKNASRDYGTIQLHGLNGAP